MRRWKSTVIIAVLLLSLTALAPARNPASPAPQGAPPNEPARVEIDDGRVRISYGGRLIFEGTLEAAVAEDRVQVYRQGDKIEEVILLFSPDMKDPLKLAGSIRGGAEAIPCEADRRDRRGAGPLIVRHVSGLSRSLSNRAVYDRGGDWVLSVDAGPRAAIRPRETGGNGRVFDLEVEGREIVLRFLPRFFQKHRNLPYFEPWAYRPWPGSVAGWISWFAFYDEITEQDVVETAGVFAEVLRPYGYEYFQIDDGFQQIQGAPEKWLVPNAKFPRGLKFLADTIKARGLKPGLWTAASVLDPEPVKAHPGWFVRDGRGLPVRGNWIGWVLDASVPEALDAMVRPLYRGLREQGWEYFKLDALRHLRYEGYNANRGYFEKKKTSLVGAYRRYVEVVRDTIGRESFLLGCWGIRPELAGLIDACRIGDDGFAYAGLSQYNSFNNIVWRNDPDHIELSKDGWRSTLVTTLTGSLLLLTDKPAVYRTAAVEPAKRTSPVLFTVPGQIYDVDPSRSQLLDRADAEVSGSGPRVFDGGYTPACHLYLLEIDRPFEGWSVLGRTGGDFAEIRFSDLGLDPSTEYYVFEFWTKKLLGSSTGGFAPGPIDPAFRCQAFAIRERRPHPQLIATSRHVTCGGVDLEDVRWDGTRLTGRSRGVKGDPYVLYLTEPLDYRFEGIEASGAGVGKAEREGRLLKLTLAPEGDAVFGWSAKYTRNKE